MLPRQSRAFVLRRNSYRRFPEQLWPDGRNFPLDQARRLGLPEKEVVEATGLRLFGSGEWLFAKGPDRDWWLLGPLNRLLDNRPEAEVLRSAGGLWRAGNFAVKSRGRYFLLAASPEALDRARGGWLSDLPDWPELDDLLMAGDLVLFRKREDGSFLGSIREMEGAILADGLAWEASRVEDLLEVAAPLDSSLVEDAAVSGFPWLRESAPWDPQGRPLPLRASRSLTTGPTRSALKLWGRGPWAAYSQSLLPAWMQAEK